MESPWLSIPLEDYEGHMGSAEVDQAGLLASEFRRAVRRAKPLSLALIGCAGGNGLEHVNPRVTQRVVAIDIQPEYARAVLARYGAMLPGLEVHVADVQDETFSIAPVDLIHAALLFEYVDVERTLARLAAICNRGGTLGTVLQLPAAGRAPVTPSPFPSLQQLAPFMHLVAPWELESHALRAGFRLEESDKVVSSAGKAFAVQRFRRV